MASETEHFPPAIDFRLTESLGVGRFGLSKSKGLTSLLLQTHRTQYQYPYIRSDMCWRYISREFADLHIARFQDLEHIPIALP